MGNAWSNLCRHLTKDPNHWMQDHSCLLYTSVSCLSVVQNCWITSYFPVIIKADAVTYGDLSMVALSAFLAVTSFTLNLLADTISSVGLIYTAFLFAPIPIGFFFKKRDIALPVLMMLPSSIMKLLQENHQSQRVPRILQFNPELQIFSSIGLKFKKYGAAAVGLGLMLAACGVHSIHSFVTIMGTWVIIKISPKYSHSLTLGWTFLYLLFFHKFTSFKFPQATHLTKSVQLLLTLKMVSIANEVQECIKAKEQEVKSGNKSPAIGVIHEIPGLPEILCYSYCYVGLMTGLFYRYRTYHDWLNQRNPSEIPTWKPLLYRLVMMPVFAASFLTVSYICPPEYVENAAFYEKGLYFRLFYMMPVSFVFRMRNYLTWYGAESTCIAAGFGAYPTWAHSKPGGGPTVEYECESENRLADGETSSVDYDYETIRNISPYGTEFCIKVKDGIRCWNMTVQWWLYQYTYKNVAFLPHAIRSVWTMAISAYWHGLRPGYHLSFLTIPLCLAAEEAMEDGLLRHLSPSGRACADWAHRLLKMRVYDYVCVGFLLRSFEGTIRYWSSVHYFVHVGALSFLVAGKTMGALHKRRR